MQTSAKAKYILEKQAKISGALPYLALGAGAAAAGYLAAPAIKENYDYTKYVAQHKYNVISPMRQMGLGLGQALKHDLSKLSPAEFGPYRNWFTGPKGVTGTRDPDTYAKWRTAVQHHYHAPGNLHHYRALGLEQSTVPLKYRMEAVADWYSVQKTKGSTNEQFSDWYKRLRTKLPIHPETQSAIDERLGINKTAFNMSSAERVLKVTKGRMVKIPARPFSGDQGIVVDAAHFIGLGGVKPGKHELGMVGGKILKGYSGDTIRTFREGKRSAPIAPQQRKMVEAIARGHELDETKSIGTAKFVTHLGPDVVLKEHNRLKTLPKEFSVAKTIAGEHREEETQGIRKVMPGFTHGESPRLSRHAIKRLTPIIEKANL